MQTIEGKIRLSDLATRLGVTNASLRYHLKNDSGLGISAVKLGGHVTDDFLLSIDSVLNYLQWAFSHSKKLKYAIINEVREEVECLNTK